MLSHPRRPIHAVISVDRKSAAIQGKSRDKIDWLFGDAT
jgi:hypothetical protein